MVEAVTAQSPPRLGRWVTPVMALACGVGVANVYFPQALTPLLTTGLGVAPDSAALVATAAQLGYGAGIFLLVPLGDRLPRRPLIAVLFAVTGLGLLAAGFAPALPALVSASVLVGAATVVPQILLPMAAGLVGADRRGAVVGVLQGGLIGGILLARAFGGFLGEWLGWRAPYLVAAFLAVVLAAVLARALPASGPPARTRYPALLAATVRLLRDEPALRRSCGYQAMLFAGFSAAWTCLALLLHGPAYHLGADAVGVIALVGAASVFAAPATGRWVDRRGPDVVNLACILAAVAAAAVLLAGSRGGVAGLVVLGAGMLLLDIAVQCGQVANQARIFALDPAARSRLNTAYMTSVFVAGSAGSWLGTRLYGVLGWAGVCGLLAAAAFAALAWHLVRPGERSLRKGQST
ncbi:MFS transporter [Amycolatopsis sp. NPDC026612]|uniref:MFS transporter n=1 Tax=Amycolatopsis sp. NPDC026612 TaxID=3155466 RepID=UPI0033E24108